ncbi:MAG: insulinase family protein, partial [Candidatus Aminicenantes bacterium]|nr:insulinase family protein [Candidatus Aminicenantes bacterium]
KDLPRVLEICADILTTPAFSQEKIDLAKNQLKESIRRRWDMPSSVARLIYSEKLYGEESPYARRITAAAVDNISREDLVTFHRKYFAPNNMHAGITGDISSAEVKKALARVFEKWDQKKIVFPPVPPVQDQAKKVVYYVYKDTPQANIALGHLGVGRNHPDQYKLAILNYVLGGGGFSSRLMRELRSNRGWTYGIYGGVNAGRDRGPFMIASTLKAEVLGEALPLVEEIVKSMQAEAIKDEEMEEAKNYMINSFVFRFESRLSILMQKISYTLMGYPEDYLEKYIDNIKKVTREEVLEAARKHLEPGRMMIVVCGDKKRFDKPLETFGPVEEVDLQSIIDKERAGAVK